MATAREMVNPNIARKGKLRPARLCWRPRFDFDPSQVARLLNEAR